MGRDALRIALLAAALSLGSAPKTSAEHSRAQKGEKNPPASTNANQHSADTANAQAKGCPGTDSPSFDCPAVSAKAAEDQVGQARRYAGLFIIELVIGALTAFGAVGAAVFAAGAAKAARDTVNVLTDVERADIFVTLEDFSTSNVFIRFNIVASNLGRSAALITHFGIDWQKTADESGGIFMADPTPRIVGAGKRFELRHAYLHDREEWREKRFLALAVTTQSPIVGEVRILGRYEVYDSPTIPHHTWYRTVEVSKFDGNGNRIEDAQHLAPLWRRLLRAIHVRTG